MSDPLPQLKRAEAVWAQGSIRYSICSLVTDIAQYHTMVRSFQRRGFDAPDCEYIYIDNSAGNREDGYSGLNLFLSVARGEFIILCHQDIELIADGRSELDAAIDSLERFDPRWALAGNAGGIAPGQLAMRISDPHGENLTAGKLPALVHSLDENFIVAKRRANLALSRDLSGFHLYGADICIVAQILGWQAYVIDFHLRHWGAGKRDRSLTESRRALVAKYARALRPRWVATTCEVFFLSGSGWLARLLSSRIPSRLASETGSARRIDGVKSE